MSILTDQTELISTGALRKQVSTPVLTRPRAGTAVAGPVVPAIAQAILAGLTIASAAVLVWQLAAGEPFQYAGLIFDRLSAALTLLVAAVGWVCLRYSARYLHGDPKQARFLRLLTLTVCSAYLLMLSTNLLLLFAAWALTSTGLHGLLTHYGTRAEAQRAARKKFLISRIGDLALLGAIAVAWQAWGTLDLTTITSTAAAHPTAASAVALLAVLAALTKSAQFPFHSWLPETMESPTPVSALMHAGIINAGGALLLRMSPLLVQAPTAMLVLVIVGTVTVVLGTIAMWPQTKVKRSLAWSTIAQMGFMMVQCGLGAFAAAALHILAHGAYKAWSFLRSSELPAGSIRPNKVGPGLTLLRAGVGTLVSLPVIALAAYEFGIPIWHAPGEMALAAIVALAAGQAWVVILGRPNETLRVRVTQALALSVLGIVVLFTLYDLAGLLMPNAGHDLHAGTLAWISAAIPVIALTGLCVLHACLPLLNRRPAGRAFWVHALHGFYLGALADRVVAAVWPNRLAR